MSRHLIEVTHIESCVGPKGGRCWRLTLACGHLKAVRQPKPPIVLPVAHKGNARQERRQRRLARMSTYLAPHKAKCLLGCTQMEDSHE